MKALNIIFYLAAATAIVALPFLLVNWARYTKSQSPNWFKAVKFSGVFPTKSVAFFVLPILVAIAVAEFMTSYSRDEALSFINELSGNYTVYVNNQTVSNSDAVVSALKTIAPQLGHHSHPTKKIQITIQRGEHTLALELARDSGDQQEYWVFYPKYAVTSNNEIGRITTPLFDEF